MNYSIINSSIHISLGGESSLFDKKAINNIDKIFNSLFMGSGSKVSDIEMEKEREMIFEINTPIMKDETLMKEFFEKLEVILEVLEDYNPHFTQFEGGNIK